MRIRSLLVLAATFGGAVLTPVAANAIVATNTVTSTTGLPDQLGIYSGCSAPTDQVPFDATHISGPVTPPLGTGSLLLKGSDTPYLDFGSFFGQAGISATSLQGLTFEADPVVGVAGVSIVANYDQGSGAADELEASVGTAGRFTGFDLSSATLHTFHSDGQGHLTNDKHETYATWLGEHPGATLADAGILSEPTGTPCADFSSAAVDDLAVTVNSSQTVFDFEPGTPPAVVTIHAPSTITSAGATVTGRVAGGGTGLTGEGADLYAKPGGANAFSKVGSASADTAGNLSFHYQPAHPSSGATQLKWVYSGDINYAAAASSIASVKPALSTLTLKVADTSLTHTQRASLSGKTTPGAKNRIVTIFDKQGRKQYKLGTAKTSRSGSWRASVEPPTGKSQVYATVGTYNGYAGATSKAVTVRRK